ncbi:GNAT family N-acetyltransferase [Polynucleobacter sp. MWH-Braz-FAM2G]|uniref:GNAT family N-acetyltransferase n=1 Tax=Polynucleobacter sp. MWH-Braz-FAM2G TaxID=1855883 RepID=UPI001BFD6A97|nr:GNAT family N-acetyltransferase [Polynucleobacter sp. MWH-Braz-FAM2G]QWD90759.1 GNAT family N-acetyltransferase [Polynucleobacter sp. MWH-Braz-FAM2G]
MEIQIYQATTEQDWRLARTLITQYIDWLDLDLSFQNIDDEFANLEKKYSGKNGNFYLAKLNNEVVGCIGTRKHSNEECEIKRLFVCDGGKGNGIGKLLINTATTEARKQNYKAMLLDTLPKMSAALKLYKEMGFVETSAYCYHPHPKAIFLKLTL